MVGRKGPTVAIVAVALPITYSRAVPEATGDTVAEEQLLIMERVKVGAVNLPSESVPVRVTVYTWAVFVAE